MELRLGDILDDYCIKCRRLTNHSVVSLLEGQVAKVRCRSCYHDHTYLHEIAPPSRKDLKKAELLNAALKAEADGTSGPALDLADIDADELVGIDAVGDEADIEATDTEDIGVHDIVREDTPSEDVPAEKVVAAKPAKTRSRKS